MPFVDANMRLTAMCLAVGISLAAARNVPGAVGVTAASPDTVIAGNFVPLVGSEKPCVGYQAAKALRFAVDALDAHVQPQLLEALQSARGLLDAAAVGSDSDRQSMLREADQERRAIIAALAAPGTSHD